MKDLKCPHIFVRRNCKYLVCKWGSGKRNYSAAKYILESYSVNLRRPELAVFSQSEFPLLFTGWGIVECVPLWAEVSSSPRHGANPVNMTFHPCNDLGLCASFGQGESALTFPCCRAKLFLHPLHQLMEHKELDYINLCPHTREEERLTSSSLHRSNDILALGCCLGLSKPWISMDRSDSNYYYYLKHFLMD